MTCPTCQTDSEAFQIPHDCPLVDERDIIECLALDINLQKRLVLKSTARKIEQLVLNTTDGAVGN